MVGAVGAEVQQTDRPAGRGLARINFEHVGEVVPGSRVVALVHADGVGVVVDRDIRSAAEGRFDRGGHAAAAGEQLHGPNHPALLPLLEGQANNLFVLGQHAAALALCRRAHTLARALTTANPGLLLPIVELEARIIGERRDPAAAALADGAIDGWAEVLVASTEAQRALHPGLVGPAHQAAIDVARAAGAVGWKVNGAGGDGGSLTVVAPSGGRGALEAALVACEPAWQSVRLTSAPGLQISRP